MSLLHVPARLATFTLRAAVAFALSAASCGPGISAPDTLPLYVDVNATGDAPSEIRILLDGLPAATLDATHERVRLDVRAGKRVVALGGIPMQCSVADGAERTVDVQPGRATFIVVFDIVCP